MFARFESCCGADDLSDLGHLVFALLAEESIGGACLHRLGLTMDVLAGGSLGSAAAEAAKLFLQHGSANIELPDLASSNSKPQKTGPNWYVAVRDRAAVIAKRSSDGPAVSSEHLVIAMTEVDSFAKQVLQQHGIQNADVVEAFGRNEPVVESLNVDLTLSLEDEPAAVPPDLEVTPTEQPLCLADNEVTLADNSPVADPAQSSAAKHQSMSAYDQRVHALLDANLNRAREGLRVLEDCARFVLCCENTTQKLKHVRHQLVEAELRLRERHSLIQQRDVEADAGTHITTANEQRRSNLRDIMTANCRRMQEAIRSLEEFGKLIDGSFSEACKQLRYQTYEAEQMLENGLAFSQTDSHSANTTQGRSRQYRKQLLSRSQLYVLMTEEFCSLPWQQTAEAVLVAGADILQLREKQLSTYERIRRAAWLQDLCLEHDALFFMNDSAEVAKAVSADGLHVGQTDLSVQEARQILDADQLIGLSTHDRTQLQQATDLGVDCVGVGPMFSTTTKSFDQYSGPAFAAEAAANASMPWFAIGGINQTNLQQLLDVGVRRIAVCGTVLGASSPPNAARDLKAQLVEADRAN